MEEREVSYIWMDIKHDANAERFVKETNHGNRSVRTIIFSDDGIFTKSLIEELEEKIAEIRL